MRLETERQQQELRREHQDFYETLVIAAMAYANGDMRFEEYAPHVCRLADAVFAEWLDAMGKSSLCFREVQSHGGN